MGDTDSNEKPYMDEDENGIDDRMEKRGMDKAPNLMRPMNREDSRMKTVPQQDMPSRRLPGR